MQDKKGIFVVWVFFLVVVLMTMFSALLLSKAPSTGEGKGIFGLGSLEPYLFALLVAACGGLAIHLYRRWKTKSIIRYVYLLFAVIAFYHAVNFLVVFSATTSFWGNSLVLSIMAVTMVRHYFFSKPR